MAPSIETLADSQTGSGSTAQEVLAFKLGGEEYGIDILKVQEIRSYDKVTGIADAPAYLKGVINLRGSIVPIVDMRIRLHMDSAAYDQFTVVIIVNVGRRVMGIVVDGVSDVVTLEADQIKPPPAIGTALSADYLVGLGTLDERMLILIDLDRMMSSLQSEFLEAEFA